MKSILFSDIRIRADYRQEAIPLIQNAIDRSGLMKKISAALFATQDMAEFDRLLMMLKEQIQSALQPLYEQHMGIFISAECKNNPGKAPEPYCEVNGCILRDKIWIPLENTANSFLIIRLEEKKPAA